MKILILTHVVRPYQSPRSFRSTELAIEMAKQGNDITLYAVVGPNKYELQKNYKRLNIELKDYRKFFLVRKNSSEKLKLAPLHKVLITLFKRVFNYPNIEFLFNIPKSLKNEKEYDLLISIAKPHSIHWGTAWALKKNPELTRTWVADCGDPFMGNRFGPPPFYFKYLEKWFLMKAHFITVPAEGAKNAYLAEFRKKIHVIPQGFSFENIKTYQSKVENPIPTFAYAGAVYKRKRDPTIFLEYLSSLKLNFKFIIYTDETDLYKPFLQVLGEKLELRNYISREDLIFELSKMDFLVNLENIHNEQVPSKLIDYSLTGRPILSIGSVEINENAINDFLSGDYSHTLSIDLERFKIENVAGKFLELAKMHV